MHKNYTFSDEDLSVAMITMNEEGAIAQVVQDIKKIVPGAEIIIVDSSKDQTAEIAMSLGVKVIKQVPPKGYGPAMDLVLKSAKGKVIVTLDCDNTYPVEEIPTLAALVLNDECDIVDASRLKNKPEAMPWINYIGNRVFALMASLVFFKHFSDLHSGMRAYRKSMIHELKYEPKGAALPVELLLRPIRMGYRYKNRYIAYRFRVGESKMNPLDTSLWTVKRIFRSKFK